MTGDAGDARTEAERIVAEHGAQWAKAHRGDDDDLAGSTYRLVAALAAAIEVAEQHTSCPHADAGEPERCAECRLIAAVIPLLRARAGEEPG